MELNITLSRYKFSFWLLCIIVRKWKINILNCCCYLFQRIFLILILTCYYTYNLTNVSVIILMTRFFQWFCLNIELSSHKSYFNHSWFNLLILSFPIHHLYSYSFCIIFHFHFINNNVVQSIFRIEQQFQSELL